LYLKNRIIIFFLFLYFVLSFIFFLLFSSYSLFRFVLVDFVLLLLVSFHFVFMSLCQVVHKNIHLYFSTLFNNF